VIYARQIRIKHLGTGDIDSVQRSSRPAPKPARGATVYDIISVLFVLAFFALCVAYTNACDRILGPDDQAATQEEPDDRSGPTDEAVAA
jgi:hypothetical protein